MICEIVWNYPALATFYTLHPNTAASVDGAVIHFAKTGEGDLEWVPPHHRLRVGSHQAVLAVDTRERIIVVLRLYRRQGGL